MRGCPSSRSSLSVAILMLVTLLVGCDHGPQRMPVSGRVTLDGKPLDYGSITFVPDPAGPKASAIIEAGQYQLESDRGPLVGDKIVEIRAPRYPTDAPPPSTSAEKLRLASNAPEALPERYNTKSELRCKVTAEGPNEFDFELTSQ